MKLFDRSFRLTLGADGQGFDVSSLDFEAKVKKTLLPKPNTCEIKVYNMTEKTRSKLESTEAGKLTVKLEAGYGQRLSQVYLGEIRQGYTRRHGNDVITTITTGESEKKIQKANLNIPIGPGAKAGQTLLDICAVLIEAGIGEGNAKEIADLVDKKGRAQLSPKLGCVLEGNAALRLSNYCRTISIEWSIQDGVLQFTDHLQPINQSAVLLSATTGLVESPSIEADGTVDATCLFNPQVKPGSLIVIDSLTVKGGGYRVRDVEYDLNTFGKPWYIKLKARKYT